MKNIMKRIVAVICVMAMLLTCFIGFIPNTEVQAANTVEPTPVVLDGFKHITLSDYETADGKKFQDGTYDNTATDKNYQLTSGEATLNKMVFSMQVTFTSTGFGSGLYLGKPNASTNGFWIYLKDENTLVFRNLLRVSKDGGKQTEYHLNGSDRVSYSASEWDVDTFLNKEFLLQMSFEYGDFDNIASHTYNDLKLGMYVNGKLCKGGETILSDIGFIPWGTGLSLERIASASDKMTFKSVYPNGQEIEPIYLDGFKHITLSDYETADGKKFQDGTYDNTATDKNYQLASGEATLNKMVFSMKVTFTSTGFGSGLYLGKPNASTNGFWIYLKDENTLVFRNLLKVSKDEGDQTEYHLNGSDRVSYSASEWDVDTFLNKEFLLQMSFEYGDFDNIASHTYNDLKLGMYVNGKLCKGGETILSDIGFIPWGTGLSLERIASASDKMIFKSVSVGVQEDTEEPLTATPAYLKGYGNVTLKDFGNGSTPSLADGKYQVAKTPYWNTTGIGKFDMQLLSLKVKFYRGNADTYFSFAANGSPASEGLGIYVSEDGKELYLADVTQNQSSRMVNVDDYKEVFTAEKAGVKSFLNQTFYLQISVEYFDFDENGTNDGVKVGMYFNGELYENKVTDIQNCNLSNFDKRIVLSMDKNNAKSAIELGSVVPEPGPDPEEPLTARPAYLEDFGNVTLMDFGNGSTPVLTDGKYQVAKTPYWNTTGIGKFDMQFLSLKVKFYRGNADTYFSFAANGSPASEGLAVYVSEDGKELYLADVTQNTSSRMVNVDNYKEVFTAEKAGVKSFLNQTFYLQISVEYFDFDGEGTDDGVKLGMYFNGKLYDNKVTEIQNCNLVNFDKRIVLSMDTTNKKSAIEFGSVIPEPEPEPEEPLTATPIYLTDFGNVTLKDFGNGSNPVMEDGKYQMPKTPYWNTTGMGKFDMQLLSLKVKFYRGNPDTYFSVAANGSPASDGLAFYASKDGKELYLADIAQTEASRMVAVENYKLTFSAEKAGVKSFVHQTFLLQMSMEYFDFDGDGTDDGVKIGMYFNGKLYDNKIIEIQNCNLKNFDKRIVLSMKTNNTQSAIELGSVIPKIKPDESFKKITFSHFGILDGDFEYVEKGGFNAYGKLDGMDTLDRTVLCGDLLMKQYKNAVLCIGGGENAWYGIRITIRPNGKIGVSWIGDKFNVRYLEMDEKTAQVPLYDQWVNMMMSTEIVDGDGDGVKDDIRLGFWFNGKLYKNEFIIIPDKAAELSNTLAIYCGEEGAKLSIRSVKSLIEAYNFARFGLDENWQKTLLNTGMKGRIIVGGSKDVSPFTGDFMKAATGVIVAGILSIAVIGAWLTLKRRRGI